MWWSKKKEKPVEIKPEQEKEKKDNRESLDSIYWRDLPSLKDWEINPYGNLGLIVNHLPTGTHFLYDFGTNNMSFYFDESVYKITNADMFCYQRVYFYRFIAIKLTESACLKQIQQKAEEKCKTAQ